MKPRVVQFTTNLARGGAETQVAHLASRLPRRGFDVHVVSLVRPTAFADELAAEGVEVHAPGLRRVPGLLRDLAPDVLHCHMFHANVAGRMLRIALPFPLVISTLHSLAESGQSTARVGARDLAYRITGRLADVTVGVASAVIERHAAAAAIDRRRARVIPNGIDTVAFAPDPAVRAEVRRSLGIPEDEWVWLAAGRVMWKKDYSTMLAAFARGVGGTLLIAGDGPDLEALRKTAPEEVQFLGARTDVDRLMRAADGFVLSSVVEGLPVALLEAAAAGLTCVATDVGGMREIGVPYLVPPRSPEALASAMTEAARIPVSIRERVLERFDIENVVEQWVRLYREML